MKLHSEWRCGNCGKVYSFDEFLRLNKVKSVESDIEPMKQHGYTPVCECGYRFSLDRWRLNDNLKIKINEEERNILISTIDLEFNHGFEDDEWYETMIFVEDVEGKNKIKCYYENRYENRNDAIEDHNRILNLLKDGKYIIEDNDDEKTLIILDNEIK